MTELLDTYKVELFPVSPRKIADVKKLEFFEVSAHFNKKASDLFPDEQSRYWHLAELMGLRGLFAVPRHLHGHSSVIFIGDKSSQTLRDPFFAYGLKEKDSEIVLTAPNQVSLDPDNNEVDFEACKRLVLEHMKRSVVTPYELGLWEIADTRRIADSDIPKVSVLLKGLRAYRAANFHLVRIQDRSTYFLETIPRSVIRNVQTLDYLLRSKLIHSSNLPHVFPFVRMPWGGKGKLVRVLENRRADQPAKDDPVLGGRSFLEFAAVFYPNLNLGQSDSPLALVGTSRGPRLYSLEALYPSITYEIMESLDPAYFSKLVSRLRLESARNRLDDATDWTRILAPHLRLTPEFSFEVDAVPFELFGIPRPLDISVARTGDFECPGGILARPPMSFTRANNATHSDEFTVYPEYADYKGTINDIMNHPELKPLNAPENARVIAFVQDSLISKWKEFEQALIQGTGPKGYRGFKETFGVNLSIKTIPVSDFFGDEFREEISRLDERNVDCVLNIVPRILDDAAKNSRIYLEPKTQIMRKGIPVQVLTNDERKTASKEKSLTGRARNSHALFSTACNILGKIGVILTALAQDFADEMVGDSAIMGYDVARVFPQLNDPDGMIRQKRTSVPLAAPLFIFDNRGADIKQQKVYRPSKETVLFAEHGSEILSLIGDVSTLIVHKDGKFSSDELAQLKKHLSGRPNRTLKRIIPISIVKSEVPRVFRPDYTGEGFELKAGTFLSLSSKEYILVTTPTAGWTEKSRGWPCPLWIQMHDREVGNEINPSERFKLLYQIFALTKMHTGSLVPTKSPVSIHYSNMVAQFLRRVGETHPDFLDKFIQPLPGRKFLSKWYT